MPTHTTTVVVDCWHSASCPTPGSGGLTTDYSCFYGTWNCTFIDPLPPGAMVQTITATPWLVRAATSTQGMAAFTYINGQQIGDQQIFLNRSVCGSGSFQPYPTAGPSSAYRYGSENTLTVDLIQTDLGHGCLELVQLDIEYEPPPPVDFEIKDTTPTADRRVLLSNTSRDGDGAPNYPYPHFQNLLARDRVIPVAMRTNVDGVGTSGIPVTLRVLDPPDPSPYVAGGSGIVQPVPGSDPNDNVGALPTLTATGLMSNGNGTYSIVSGENGFIGLELTLAPDAAAGDNYRVEATIADGSGTTSTSGEITVWKRVFLEKRQMFRRGAALATDAPAGVTSIIIRDVPIASLGVNEFSRNDNILLLHAPAWGQPKTGAGFYSGLYQVAARPHSFRARAMANGPGTVSTNGTAQIVGVGTRFRRLDIGDVLNIGPDARVVTAIADNTHLTVHSPATSSAENQAYLIGDSQLIVGANYVRLQLNRPLTESYIREPLASRGTLTLNDAVVRIGAGTVAPADYFDVDTHLIVGAFVPPWNKPLAAAYTEYVEIAPGAGTESDAIRPVPRTILTNDELSQQFIDKWFLTPTATSAPTLPADPNQLRSFVYRTAPNHQLLVVGDTNTTNVQQSGANGFLLNPLENEQAAVVNRSTMEQRISDSNSPMYGGDIETLVQRTTVHEMVHQWGTNRTIFGDQRFDHCHPQVAYDSTQPYPTSNIMPPAGFQFCLMSNSDEAPQDMRAPWDPNVRVNMVQYFYRNGWTSCHITPAGSGWHSEYGGIRQAPDPWMP